MSIKLIHTADWHLGQTFFGYGREREQDAFLDWLLDLLNEREADALLISGDVFDVANPSAVSQRKFFRFLKEANRKNPGLQIVVTAGNHDSATRLEAPVPLLEELGTSVIGIVRCKEDGTIDLNSLVLPLYNKEGRREALCLAVPFLRQGDYPAPEEGEENTYKAGVRRMYRQLCDYAASMAKPGEALLAMGHLHATGAELTDDDRSERVILGGLESVPVDAFDASLAYTALGHIHKAQRVGGRETVRYAGSPLPMSFSEVNYRHQVVCVTVEGGRATEIESVPVPLTVPLLRIPQLPSSPEEVLEQLAALPEREGEEPDNLPFVEVRVVLTEPDPGFRHRVEMALEGKAARLTSIVPSYPRREDGEALPVFSYNDLQRIDPLEMLRHTFTAKYGGDLPEEISNLFKEVMQEAGI